MKTEYKRNRISKEELLNLFREWSGELSFNLPDELEGDYYDICVLNDWSYLNCDFLVAPRVYMSLSYDYENISYTPYVLYTKKDVLTKILRHKKINQIYE